jgi:hypothetical protein
MYESFSLADFRGIAELNIPDLGRLNIITGANESGKTSLLEAIFLHAGGRSPQLGLTVDALRGFDQILLLNTTATRPPWDLLFRDFDTTKTIRLSGVTKSGHYSIAVRSLRTPDELANIAVYLSDNTVVSPPRPAPVQALEWVFTDSDGKASRYFLIQDARGLRAEPAPPPPLFLTYYVGTRLGNLAQEVEMFGKLQVQGTDGLVLDTIRLVDPRVKRLITTLEGQQPQVYADVGTRQLCPLKVMGEGLVRLFAIAIYLVMSKDGVLLIDEIENGLHYSLHRRVWRLLAKAARSLNVQLFATTHSFEAIAAAAEQLQRGPADYVLHRLDRRGGIVSVASFDATTLKAALSTGLEVR